MRVWNRRRHRLGRWLRALWPSAARPPEPTVRTAPPHAVPDRHRSDRGSGSRRGYLELAATIALTLALFPVGPAQVPDVPKLDAHALTSPGTALWFGVVGLTASWFTVRAMLGAVRAAAYVCATGRAATTLGLRLVALGGPFGLTNVNYQSFMHPLLPRNIDTPIAHLLTALGFLGAGSASLGVCLPALAGAARRSGLATWWRVRRDYRAPQPLWRDLTAAVPSAALHPHSRSPSWQCAASTTCSTAGSLSPGLRLGPPRPCSAIITKR